jgi:hypothetical protein
MPVRLPREVQLAVDEYLELYRQYKQIDAALKELRGVIEPFLKEHAESAIEGSNGEGKIELTRTQRPIMNAQYTTYGLADISALLPANVLKKCTVQVIDKDRLEALGKLGEIPEDVLGCRQTKESVSFTVRLNSR